MSYTDKNPTSVIPPIPIQSIIMTTNRLAENLIVVSIIDHSSNLLRRGIGLDNLILAFHPLFILGPVLLLDLLVILDHLNEF